MDELIRLTLTLIVLAITLPPLFTILLYLIPFRTREIQITIEQRPRRAVIIGAINTLFFGLVIAVFSNEGEGGGLIGVIVLLFVLTLVLMGLTAFVKMLQERIYGDDAVGSVLKTAVLFTGALLTPIFGWFILLPLTAVMGLGAAIPGLIKRRKKKIEELS